MDSTRFQPASDQLYHRVQRFYSERLRRLDAGDAEGWAESFTEDGVFETNARPDPSRGRSAIENETKRAAARLGADGVERRHWIGMMAVNDEGAPHLGVEAYCLVVETARGGVPRLAYSLTLRSRVVIDGDLLRVSHEAVSRDDL